MQSGPCPWSEGRDDVDWPIPVTVIAGGEGRGAREREEAMAHLLVCLGAREDGWRSSSALDRARRRDWSTAMELRWGIGGEEWWVSFTSSR